MKKLLFYSMLIGSILTNSLLQGKTSQETDDMTIYSRHLGMSPFGFTGMLFMIKTGYDNTMCTKKTILSGLLINTLNTTFAMHCFNDNKETFKKLNAKYIQAAAELMLTDTISSTLHYFAGRVLGYLCKDTDNDNDCNDKITS